MRILLAVAIAVALIACGEDTITHAPGENPEIVIIAINENGEIFMSSRESSLSMDEFPKEVSRLLDGEGSYSFVIQSDEGGRSHAKKVEKLLHNGGVEERHVAISRSRP
jgi:biopolymer transport protein ExbD